MSTSLRPRRLLCLVLCLALFGASSWTSAATGAEIRVRGVTCEACLLVDMSTGDTLWSRTAHRPLPNASTTKMVTALVVASEVSLSALVRVSGAAAAVGGGGMDLSEGDVATVRDLLYVLLLDSSNEAAAALAEHVAGDPERFVVLMNRTTRSLGTTGTTFVNPHGLDEPGHVSTAADLALIGQRLLATPKLARIVASARATVVVNGTPRVVENRNVLLETYPGTIGIKTGRTLGAGEVLVAAARRGPHRLLAVAMRSQDAAVDARRLLDAGFAELRAEARRAAAAAARPDVLVIEHQAVGALVFDPAGATEVVAAEEVTGVVPHDVAAVELRFVVSDELLLPLGEGEQVGVVEVVAGDSVLATVPALAEHAVTIEEMSWAGRAVSGILRSAALIVAGVGA